MSAAASLVVLGVWYFIEKSSLFKKIVVTIQSI